MIFKSGEELIMAMSIYGIIILCMYSYYNYFNIGYMHIILHKFMK